MPDGSSPQPGGWRALLRFRRIGGEALIIGSGQVVSAAGSIVAVRLLTGVLPPAEYGELALGITVGTLALQTLLLPLMTSALRFFASAREAGDVRGFLTAMWRLAAKAVALIAAIALLTLVTVSATSTTRWNPLILAAFLYSVLSGLGSLLDAVLNAARHRATAAVHSAAAPWLRVLFAVALIRLTATAESAVAMAGYAAALALVLVSQLASFRRHIVAGTSDVQPDPARWSQAMVSYGWPFAAWGIFTWVQMASDRWALGAFGTVSDVGLYTAVYQLGYTPMIMASMLIGQVITPVLFARAGDGSDAARVNDAARLNTRAAMAMLAFTVVAFAVVTVCHPFLGRLLLAPRYRGVTHFLPWMILVGGIFATAQVMSAFFLIRNRSRDLTVPKIVTAIAGTLLSFAGARWFGMTGVVGASLIFVLFYASWIGIAAGYARRHSAS